MRRNAVRLQRIRFISIHYRFDDLLDTRAASEMFNVRIFSSARPGGRAEARELAGVSGFPQTLTAPIN